MEQYKNYDITVRNEQEQNFEDYIIDSEYELLFNQIVMTLFTNKGEVLGYEDFGVSLEMLLFEFVDPNILLQHIRDQIAKYGFATDPYNIRIDIRPMKIDKRTSIIIDIYVEDTKIITLVR